MVEHEKKPTVLNYLGEAESAVMDAAFKDHGLLDRWSCGAYTAPTVNRHAFSNAVKAEEMRCTEDQGHEGLHRDGMCCWRTHEFTNAEVVGYRPKDRRRCRCGKPWEECEVGQAVEQLALENLINLEEVKGRG